MVLKEMRNPESFIRVFVCLLVGFSCLLFLLLLFSSEAWGSFAQLCSNSMIWCFTRGSQNHLSHGSHRLKPLTFSLHNLLRYFIIAMKSWLTQLMITIAFKYCLNTIQITVWREKNEDFNHIQKRQRGCISGYANKVFDDYKFSV